MIYIWSALAWVALSAFLKLFFYKRKVAPWEYAVEGGVAVTAILIAILTSQTLQVTDYEYRGAHVIRAEHNERWNEYIRKTCDEERGCRTNSKGEKYGCRTHYYDCSYIQNHPETFYISDSNGNTHSVNSDFYYFIAQRFGNVKRYSGNHRSYTIHGGRNEVVWDNEPDKLVSITTTHRYVNKVAASQTNLSYRPLTATEIKNSGVFEYPNVDTNFQVRSILGYSDNIAENKLEILNAVYGAEHQVRVWFLVFRNRPYSTFGYQKSHWQRGNKNEIVLCVGIDNNDRVEWADVFSWTDKPLILEELKAIILKQKGTKLDLQEGITYLEDNIPLKWERKSFADFNALSVPPSRGAVIFTHIFVLLTCGLVSFLVLKNK